jgi:heat shock protein HslJ
MKHLRPTLIALALFFTLTAEKCSKTSASVDPLTTLTGSQWNLTSLAGEALHLPEGVKTPFLTLAKDGKLSGFGGCNQLMGSMKLEGSSLSFPGLGGTKMFCKAAQPTENAFMGALRSTNAFKLDGDKLMLLDGTKELATLVKQ